MIKSLLSKIIRKKNPQFVWDKHVNNSMVLDLIILKTRQLSRNWKLWIQGKFPPFLFLGKGVNFFHLSGVQFGKMVLLEDHVHVSALGRKGVIFGDKVRIGAFSRVVASTSFDNLGEGINIGSNVGIGEYAYLGGGGGLDIGADCIIGQYFSCHPENHNYTNTEELIRLQGVQRQGISIGENCWIGSKVTILDGVTIGDNCVIAAGAVLTKSIPANSIAAGVPARVIKQISKKKAFKNPLPSQRMAV